MTRHTWRVAVTACAAGTLLVGPLAVGSTAAASDPGSTSPHELGIEQKVDPGDRTGPRTRPRAQPVRRGSAADVPGTGGRDRGRPRGAARRGLRRGLDRPDEERAVRRRRPTRAPLPRSRPRVPRPSSSTTPWPSCRAGRRRSTRPARTRPTRSPAGTSTSPPTPSSSRCVPGGEDAARALVERAGVPAGLRVVRGDAGGAADLHRHRRRQRVHDRRRHPVLGRVRRDRRVRLCRALRTDGRDDGVAERHLPRVELPRQRLRVGRRGVGQHAGRRGQPLRRHAGSPWPGRPTRPSAPRSAGPARPPAGTAGRSSPAARASPTRRARSAG